MNNLIDPKALDKSPVIRAVQAFFCLIAFSCVAGGFNGGSYGSNFSYLIFVNVLAWLLAMALTAITFLNGSALNNSPLKSILLGIDLSFFFLLLLAGIIGASSHDITLCNKLSVMTSECDTVKAGVAFSFLGSFVFLFTFGIGMKPVIDQSNNATAATYEAEKSDA